MMWVAFLRLAVRVVPMARLVRLIEPAAPTASVHDRDLVRIVSLARRATAALSRRPETRCLVRSMVVYRYLLRAGERPELRVGFERAEGRLRGHAWVQVAGLPITDDPAVIAGMTTSVAFLPGGVRNV
jgi:hypothetical protein